MKIIILFILGFLAAQTGGNSCGKKMQHNSIEPTPTPTLKVKYDRLPANITLDTEVIVETRYKKGDVVIPKIMTVEKRLTQLKARYHQGILVDYKGREIRFFEPLCRGVSRGIEGDEEDRKAKETELKELKKKFTVIVLFCDPKMIP